MTGRVMRALLTVTLALMTASVWGEAATYTIREGETLFGIARKTGVPVEVLCLVNGIESPERVKAGTTIRVPGPYVVKKGDTLFGIARAFSVPLQKLLALNRLTVSSRLRAGMKLYLPQGPGAAAPAIATAQPGAGAKQAAEGGATMPVPSGDTGGSSPTEHGKARVWPHAGKREPWSGKVPGLIIHGNRDDSVIAASGGEVKWVGPYWGYGKTVLIKGDDGLVCMYAGNEELLVNVGDKVAAGTEIAKLGVSPQGGGALL